MIKETPNGRFYVSVLCSDNVRRRRICRGLECAQFYEAIFLAGWYDGILPKSGQKSQLKRKRVY
ncbi:MAG: hypothetical protein AMXMBFR67_23160 [Nitrospira sp.]